MYGEPNGTLGGRSVSSEASINEPGMYSIGPSGEEMFVL